MNCNEQQQPSGSDIRLHAFAHSGVDYEVRARRMDGQLFAALYVAGTEHKRSLLPHPDDIPSGLSVRPIRAGYISTAEWLVKCGRWPDAESKSLHQMGRLI